ncbi:MAG TPA: ADOP family duplicated permease [Lacunisphaera sp.]|nr:ADOP family duplicated permease [Lacunisphaera sp.]
MTKTPMKLLRKCLNLFRRGKLEADMSEEMRLHVEWQAELNRQAGMNAEDARHAALREFGNVTSIQQQAREGWGWVWLEHWARDFRLAVRSLSRSPGFSLAVFLTLALCLGPNTAVLSALQALVLKPLPFAAPEQLVVVKNVGTKAGNMPYGAGVPQQLDYAARADAFSGFALFDMANTTIAEDTMPTRASGLKVTLNFFDLLGLRPIAGRFFLPEEEGDGRDRVLVLSHDFWLRQYQADPQVLGHTVRMGGENYTIVGVAPPVVAAMFTRTDFFMPYPHGPDELLPQRRFTGSKTTLLARLRPGVTPAAGQTQLETIEQRFRLEQAPPAMRDGMERAGLHVTVQPWRNDMLAVARGPLWLLSAGAAFVLLIGCVNVANLTLARVSARRAELAIRLALGAGWTDLFRQILCEVLVLSAGALAAGFALGWGTLQFINRSEVVVGRWVAPVRIDGQVVVVILLAGVGLTLAIGFLSLLILRRGGLRVGDTRAASAGGGMRAVSSALVVGQVALALLLLVGSGLLIRSFANVMAVKPGFDADHVVQGRIALGSGYNDTDVNVALRRRVLAAMKEIPGVNHVAVSSYFGVGPASSYRALPFTVRRDPPAADEATRTTAIMNPVSPGFFATMGTRLLEGRDFVDSDHANNRYAGLIVDRAFAERYFPGRSALGEELTFGAPPFPSNFVWPRIVGVVERANIVGLEERDGLPVIYVPMILGASPGFNVMASSARAPGDVLADMRRKLREIDPTLPFYNTGVLRETLDLMLLPRRAAMVLLLVFAGLALLLAAVGLYGVLAYDVTQRTREIGIRGAIGATRGQIIGLILRQGLAKAGLGLAIGLAGAFYLTRFLRTLLFDVKATDPLAFGLVAGVLLLVALLASWLPARRAAKVDPVVALRAE